jgi:hypothetical protein
MCASNLDIKDYNTDKIPNRFFERYEDLFKGLRGKKITLLELGIQDGESLRLWRDFFLEGAIVGIDIHLPEMKKLPDRIRIFQGSQSDKRFLSKVASETAPEGFDIIIDDASHIAELTRISFWYLFDNHLKAGGLFIIEDWGVGYYDDWPDGRAFKSRLSIIDKTWTFLNRKIKYVPYLPVSKRFKSHDFGLVGFIKQLIDEQGMVDLSRMYLKKNTHPPVRHSKFRQMIIMPGMVCIEKRSSDFDQDELS